MKKQDLAEVIDLGAVRARAAATTAAVRVGSVVPEYADVIPPVAEAPAEFADLYPDGLDRSTRLGTAVAEIENALTALEHATAALRDERAFEGDDAVMAAAVHVLKCHRFRDLGSGWGPLIVAIHASISNRADVITPEQAESLRRALKRLRAEPMMAFDQAIEIIDGLDDAGLVTEPKGMNALGECF